MKTVHGLHGTYRATTEISKGGVGAVYRTDDPALVYKEYHSPDKAPPRATLDRLVHIGRQVVVDQGVPVGTTPESSINWPLDIVADRAGWTNGVILPVIPKELFNEFGKPRTLEFLIMARARPPMAQARLALLLRMAEVLAYLDSQSLVHGDINGKNLAWTATGNPVMYLIDCDGLVRQSPPPTVGVQALGWADPRVQDRIVPAHDHYSDWYALALAMYRGLLLVPGNVNEKKNGGWPKPGKIPLQMNPRMAGLLHQALDQPLDAHSRPNPSAWVRALVEVYLPNGQFNEREIDALDRLAARTTPVPPQRPPTTFTPVPPIRTPTQPTPPPRAVVTATFPPGAPTPPPVPPPLRRTPAQTRAVRPPPPPQPVPTSYMPPPVAPAGGNPSTNFVAGIRDLALRNNAAWHVISVTLTSMVFFCLPVGFFLTLPWLGLTAWQVARTPSWQTGRTRALTLCAVYGAAALMLAVTMIVYLLAKPDNSATN
jgi:hypothetical protein